MTEVAWTPPPDEPPGDHASPAEVGVRRTQPPEATGIRLCGTGHLAPRDPCPNRLHDHPLPLNYNWAHEEAMRRLRKGWANKRCPECALYGWEAP